MSRTEQFLVSFNELEQYLRTSRNSKNHVPFPSLVSDAEKHNAAVRRNGRDLHEWADLRNAIVHEHPKGRVIAEVTPEALEEFQHLVDLITSPPSVFPLFQQDVRVYRDDDALTEAMGELWQEGYSQVIVRQGKRLKLLSYTGITRWMSGKIEGTSIDLDGATVGDALPSEEDGGIALVEREASVLDALDLFQTFPDRKQQRLRVVVITEHGKHTEAPIGLITASDMLEAGVS